MWSQLSFELYSSFNKLLSSVRIPMIRSAMPLTSPSLRGKTVQYEEVSINTIQAHRARKLERDKRARKERNAPLLVQSRVSKDGAGDTGTVDRGVRVERANDDLDLAVHASLLVGVSADEGEGTDTLAVETHVLKRARVQSNTKLVSSVMKINGGLEGGDLPSRMTGRGQSGGPARQSGARRMRHGLCHRKRNPGKPCRRRGSAPSPVDHQDEECAHAHRWDSANDQMYALGMKRGKIPHLHDVRDLLPLFLGRVNTGWVVCAGVQKNDRLVGRGLQRRRRRQR